MSEESNPNVSLDGTETDRIRWEAVGGQIDADRPVETLKEDLLNRGRFCHSLAHAIWGWKGHDSLVIGLHGLWGCGKSSIKNMVVSLLKEGDKAIPVIEFNPWSWSGEDRLITSFFDEVGTVLPGSSEGTNGEELAKKWKLYSARLALGGTALGALKTATEVAGIPWVPMLLSGLAQVVGTSAEIAEQTSAVNEAAEVSLEQLKTELSKQLSLLEKPVLIVIDDIDRLTNEEIRLLFRIVKVNADFPNLVFLLLFDRDVVAEALEGHVGGAGREYLEKIVQASFDVPRVEQESLDRILFDGLTNLVTPTLDGSRFDNDRWQSLFAKGMRPFFTTLRRIRRFLSSLAFHLVLFRNKTNFEVNVVDLIGIEILRLFHPTLYRSLPEHRAMIFGLPFEYIRGRAEELAMKKELYETWLNQSGSQRQEVDSLMKELFPQLNYIAKGGNVPDRMWSTWLKEQRICHETNFDRYFNFLMPNEEVSQAMMMKLLRASGSRQQFVEVLGAFDNPDKLLSALTRFEVFAKDILLSNAQEAVSSLFEIENRLPEEKLVPFAPSADSCVWRIVREILLKDSDVRRRSNLLLGCLRETDALWLPCRVVSLEEPNDGEPLSPEGYLLDSDGLKEAIKICADKIRQAASENRIEGNRLPYFLWRWRHWADETEPREWVTSYIQNPSSALAFLESIASEVYTSDGRGRGVYTQLDAKDVKAFADLEILNQSLEAYYVEESDTENSELTARQKMMLEQFKVIYDDWRETETPATGE